ncbi:MAG: tRNA (adenosine(37)-N6)-threonylcarbamoyltransferase complex dimerization subunit type 1 TsaB [Verrucomicrobia bacterium]|nr:tRNA (adenosine(37)-N6)-threonylcarbamoyltransferase complex dimerization subunit type 1 TsaB [Verrucomicrobiota bacterium]
MKGLIIDTSSDVAYVAVASDGKIIHLQTLPDARQLSKFLLPSIASAWQSFDYIAIGIGPGSFTGTRIGLITAKTLAFALSIPLLSFSSELLPDLDQIAEEVHKNFTLNKIPSQIELVYFPSTT